METFLRGIQRRNRIEKLFDVCVVCAGFRNPNFALSAIVSSPTEVGSFSRFHIYDLNGLKQSQSQSAGDYIYLMKYY